MPYRHHVWKACMSLVAKLYRAMLPSMNTGSNVATGLFLVTWRRISTDALQIRPSRHHGSSSLKWNNYYTSWGNSRLLLVKKRSRSIAEKKMMYNDHVDTRQYPTSSCYFPTNTCYYPTNTCFYSMNTWVFRTPLICLSEVFGICLFVKKTAGWRNNGTHCIFTQPQLGKVLFFRHNKTHRA